MNHADRSYSKANAFRPDAHHQSVSAVMRDQKLSTDEKRAILSAWASDIYSIDSTPALRRVPGHASPIRLRDILNALRDLDSDDPPPRGGASARPTTANIGVDGDRLIGLPSDSCRLTLLRENSDLRGASIRAHRDNIRRYKRILETDLTELERQFVVRRMAEERSALRCLATTSGVEHELSSFAVGR